MTNAVHALPDNSRRQFLKATAFGVAGAALGVRPGVGAPKTMSIMHENSFIKTFDEYFQKTLIPAYEKLTGVKIKYELVSVGGLQTRVTTVAETGTGPEMGDRAHGACIGFKGQVCRRLGSRPGEDA